jgi:ABC-type phosphate/phosphonate transport system permease subunit
VTSPITQPPVAATSTAQPETGKFRLHRHAVIGLLVALIAPFTGLAWPFAILLGIVIGQDDADRRHGVTRSKLTTFVRLLAVTGAVLAMAFFGAIIGGLIAVPIAVLSALSERAAADAEPIDRVIARLILLLMPILTYVAILAAGGSVNVRVGL